MEGAHQIDGDANTDGDKRRVENPVTKPGTHLILHRQVTAPLIAQVNESDSLGGI